MNHKKGYTLIELIIVIFVLAILAFIFGALITKATDAWIFVKIRESSLGSARLSMNRILSELRRVQNPGLVDVMTPSECGFTDIDSNAVNFKQSGTDLLRNSDVLASNLDAQNGLVFTYLDENSNVATTNATLRIIAVKLTFNKNSQLITFESAANVRNL